MRREPARVLVPKKMAFYEDRHCRSWLCWYSAGRWIWTETFGNRVRCSDWLLAAAMAIRTSAPYPTGNCNTGAVSYTHLTLPTNREV